MDSKRKEKSTMNPKIALVVGLVFIFTLTACGTSSDGTEINPSPTISEASPITATPTIQPTESSPDEPQMDMPPGAVIVYRRSGGFAGLYEEWTIYDDGRVTTKDGRQWQTSPEGVSALIDRLETVGFFDIIADPMSMIPCCDRFYYELTVASGERLHTIATYDGAQSTPANLWQAMGAVTDFLDQASR